MPKATSTFSTGDEEILLFAAPGVPRKNVMIDASLVPADPANFGRRRLAAGTALTRSPNLSPTGKAQYQRYTGSGKIEGILGLPVEFIDGTSNSDTARGIFTRLVTFRASKIVDYSTYGNVMASTLATCSFENV